MTAAVWACREKSRRETEARQLRPAAKEGQGTGAQAHRAPQVPVLETTDFSAKYRTLKAACAPGGAEATPGRISSEPGPPNPRVARRRDFFDATSWGAKTRSWRGAGRGRAPTAHSTPAANSPHKVGFVSAPVPSPPGNSSAAPRGGRARRGAPRPRRSPAGRVSAGGQRALGAAQRQPSHRGARVPFPGPGFSGADSGGAQRPG